MKGPAKATGVGGRLIDQGGREAKRARLSQAIDEVYPDVDHGAGAAPAIQGEVAFCPECHAIYRPKQWTLDEKLYSELAQNPEIERLQCPSCRMIARSDFHGELHVCLTGLERFMDQIKQTVLNEEVRARQKNPHSRIGKITETPNELVVLTVNPALAHRMGARLKRSFHGTHLDSNYTEGTPYARVYWGHEVPSS